MPVHLVLRLKAPIASFGIVAGEEVRASGAFPSRSMVLGLIGNALGLDRCCDVDMQRLNQLQAGTRFAALMLSLGAHWEDVQNARVPTLGPTTHTIVPCRAAG
jgi:CRISPR system Cascade subunit CasD